MPVDVAVTIERDDWTKALGDIEARAAKVVGLTLGRACPGLDIAEVSFLFADDATLQTLNRTWRDKDAPTNVLSFPTRALRVGEIPVAAFPGTPLELGDVALAFETIAREAEAQGKTLADHLDHLIVHGTLHLLGHDHETDEEAALMEGLEVAILDSLGVADPYAPEREHG